MVDFECLDREEQVITLAEIRKRLIEIFRKHIGLENAINPTEVFMHLYKVNPLNLDIFKRMFWWDIAKRVMRDLRSENELFIINKRTKLFVLKSQEEADAYKNILDKDIKAMKEMKIKADIWVRNKKYLKL